MAESALSFEAVSFSWEADHPLLEELTLEIAPNECVALVGRNGAGKSTLFKLACGLNTPERGRVRIGTLDTAEARAPQLAKQVALMFQEAERQICHDRVAAEVGFAPRLAGHDAAEIRRRVEYALELTGLSERKDSHPLDLNAGERRMLTLASLITQNTALILLDEPTRDFDAPLLARFETWMSRARDEGRAILFISHDFDFVARHATRVLHLSAGTIVANGPAVEVLKHSDLQDKTSMAAPTLPALCWALDLPASTNLDKFERQWRKRIENWSPPSP